MPLNPAEGRDMAQVVSHRPLTPSPGFAVGPLHVEFVVKSGTGTDFSPSYFFFVSIISPAAHTRISSYHPGMNNRPVGIRNSETLSHPIHVNMNSQGYKLVN
jgi:hypothetical protein